jgi:hypothetical protein
VIYVRQGNHTIAIKKYRDLNLMEFTDYVAGAINHYGAAMTFVDVVGIGAGVMDRLVQLGFRNVMGANAGFSADNPRYKNKRAEMWDTMKKWLEEGGDIPDDPILISELSSVQYKYDPTDRLLLEKKEDMKKRGLSSPDCGDSLSLTFFQPVLQNEWDEDNNGFYEYQGRAVDPVTGY